LESNYEFLRVYSLLGVLEADFRTNSSQSTDENRGEEKQKEFGWSIWK